MKVLIVEDCRTDFLVAKQAILNKYPRTEITRADCLSCALKELKINDFDAILADLQLRDCCGKSTIEEIRKYSTAPIMACSGGDSDKLLDLVIESGATRFVQKGLVDTVQRIQIELEEMVKEKLRFDKIKGLIGDGSTRRSLATA